MSRKNTLLISIGLYAAMYLLLTVGLGFDMFRSDIRSYWNESYHLSEPFSTWWVPGYPFLIALVRVATGEALPPLMVMLCIQISAFVVGVLSMYDLAKELGSSRPDRWSLLYAVYPFVGLTYSVYPYADSVAIALFTVCLLCYLRRRWVGFAISLACVILVHKAMWFFVAPLAALIFLKHKDTRWYLALAGVPIVVLITAGAFYHGDLLWFMRWSSETLLKSRGHLPVLDGIAGPFLEPTGGKMIKGSVVLGTFAAAAVLLYFSHVRGFWVGAYISLGIVIMGFIVNRYEIWSMVRFSRVLIVPAAFLFSAQRASLPVRGALLRVPFPAWVGISLITNAAFAYYLAKVFFGGE